MQKHGIYWPTMETKPTTKDPAAGGTSSYTCAAIRLAYWATFGQDFPNDLPFSDAAAIVVRQLGAERAREIFQAAGTQEVIEAFRQGTERSVLAVQIGRATGLAVVKMHCNWCGHPDRNDRGTVTAYPEGLYHSGCHARHQETELRIAARKQRTSRNGVAA